MKQLINFIQQLLIESCLLVYNICISILADLDKEEDQETILRENIGEVMILINIIVTIGSSLILIAKILIKAIEVYNLRKTGKNNEKQVTKFKIEEARKSDIGEEQPSSIMSLSGDTSGIELMRNRLDMSNMMGHSNQISYFPAAGMAQFYYSKERLRPKIKSKKNLMRDFSLYLIGKNHFMDEASLITHISDKSSRNKGDKILKWFLSRSLPKMAVLKKRDFQFR